MSLNQFTEKKVLFILRGVWLFSMFVPLLLLTTFTVIAPAPEQDRSEPSNFMLGITLMLLLIMVPFGFLIRLFHYKRNRVENRVAPKGYYVGNVVFWGCCMGAAVPGIMLFVPHCGLTWHIFPALIALCVLAMSFPHGRPMRDLQDQI